MVPAWELMPLANHYSEIFLSSQALKHALIPRYYIRVSNDLTE